MHVHGACDTSMLHNVTSIANSRMLLIQTEYTNHNPNVSADRQGQRAQRFQKGAELDAGQPCGT